MTAQQPYTILEQGHGFELRKYAPCVIASIEIQSSFERAGNAGFMALVNYIRGNNHRRNKIAMTAPVLQETGVQLDQQFPVIEQESHHGYVISFVMPQDWSMETLPDPQDGRIVLRDIPEELVAVVRFAGRWSEKLFERNRQTLERRISRAGLIIAGPARFARFDPPWTPWFMRRNEIHIPVRKREIS